MNIDELKSKFLNAVGAWAEQRISDMVHESPSLAIPAVYMKRAAHNLIHKYTDNIGDYIDGASLFFVDDEGNFNIDTIFDDAIQMFKNVKTQPYSLGLLRGAVGEGNITIELPENIVTDILFGANKTLRITAADILELKKILTQ